MSPIKSMNQFYERDYEREEEFVFFLFLLLVNSLRGIRTILLVTDTITLLRRDTPPTHTGIRNRYCYAAISDSQTKLSSSVFSSTACCAFGAL